jgi:hypothetical protein
VNFTDPELVAAFTSADTSRSTFPVSNPSASIADMKRHLLGEPEHFVCYGGYKSFYLDWNFDLWRCDAWHAPMSSVWDFDKVPLIRDGCTACIADCYRDSSVMLHFAVSHRKGCSTSGNKPVDAINRFEKSAGPHKVRFIPSLTVPPKRLHPPGSPELRKSKPLVIEYL